MKTSTDHDHAFDRALDDSRSGAGDFGNHAIDEFKAGRLTVHLRRKAVAVERVGDRIASVTSVGLEDGSVMRHRFSRVIGRE